MENSRKKFKIWTTFFIVADLFCSCCKGVLHGWFQMEVFGKGFEK